MMTTTDGSRPAEAFSVRSPMTRRTFVRAAGAAAGVASLGVRVRIAPAGAAPSAEKIPRRVLGRTGIEVSCLTLGAAPCGIADDVTLEEVSQIANLAIDLGVNVIDTAPKYGKAEEGIGRALGARRKEIVLATKVQADAVADAERSLAASLKRLRTDWVDVLYFHSLAELMVHRARRADGVFTWLLKQKKAGTCRFVGISAHNLAARCLPFLESGEVDVVLANVNFADRHTYNFEGRVLPAAVQRKAGVVAMKVYGGPSPDSGSWRTRKAKPLVGEDHLDRAVRYALSVPGVATANIGVHTAEQLRKNAELVSRFKPLSDDEMAATIGQGKALAAQWGEHFGPAEE
jgi:predicted aldo/keto reductase-like oxidoreductase